MRAGKELLFCGILSGAAVCSCGPGGGASTSKGTVWSDPVAPEIAAGCGLLRLCGGTSLPCGTDWLAGDCKEPYSPGTQCALERLEAGEAFALRFDLSASIGEAAWADLVFEGAGTALSLGSVVSPDSGQVFTSPPVRCALAPREKFQSCLSAPDDDPIHHDCMSFDNWFVGCTEEKGLACPGGWSAVR